MSVLTCRYYLAPLGERMTCQSQIQAVPLPLRWGRITRRKLLFCCLSSTNYLGFVSDKKGYCEGEKCIFRTNRFCAGFSDWNFFDNVSYLSFRRD